MNVGENIRRIRKEKGLTQEQLAQMVSVKPPMLCQVERGTKTISLQLAANVADALECDLNDLVRDKKEEANERTTDF